MKYVLCLAYIVIFNLVANGITLVMDMTLGEALAALAIGGVSMLAAEYFTTKGRR